ncbi:MAG: leucine-rich repeat protein [Clostridia bacterium]|nr:leucine-rich repeat protein [Clostridia bacterium]
MTDKSIIKLFAERDEDALREVMKKYGDFCLEIAKDNVPTTEEAEECVNEALIGLWHHLAEDKPRNLPTYIAATVSRCAGCKESVDPALYKKYIKKQKGNPLPAIAAAVLVLCLIPAVWFLPKNTQTEDTTPADTTSIPETTEVIEETTAPQLESDGTQGLLYEVAEDGKSARFIGFGDCKEETVYIASSYGGLPVTEMLLGELRDLSQTEDPQIKSLTDYGSPYLKHLVISDTVEVVAGEIISSCANIESVYYGKNVRDPGIGWYTGYKTHKNFTSLEVSPENAIYYSSGNCIIEKATKTLVRGCGGSVIPDDGSVEVIGKHAFAYLRTLASIDLPESVKVIEESAFEGCMGLAKIVLPSNLQSLGESAFTHCTGIKSADLNGFTVLPKAVFQRCGRLEELKGSENLTEIGEEAFDSCSKLNITLGLSLKKIGNYAFLDCGNSIHFNGTKEEWNAIEKEHYWCSYSRASSSTMRLVICTNGGVKSNPQPLPPSKNS